MKTAILVTGLFWIMTAPALAQPGEPGDPDVPISGVEILIVTGGVLGVKKLISSRKRRFKE